MANYISSLTGSQLDSALTMVDNRVPEGWAVGERDGVPVGEESLYYHNNAKYYAEQAQAQAESAEQSAESASQVAQETADAVIAQAFVQESAEVGSIVTIDDGADDVPLKDLKVNLAINQPLHGQANPYPAGGGKNKVNADVVFAAYKTGTNTYSAAISTLLPNKFFIPSELVGVECTFSVNFKSVESTTNLVRINANVGGTTIPGNNIAGGSSGYSAVTFTPTSTSDYCNLTYGNGGSAVVVVSDIMLEAGSSRTTYAPYSNICPIYPVTEAEVFRTGKNLLFKRISSAIINTNGSISNNASYDIVCAKVKAGQDYIISVNGIALATNIAFYSTEPEVGAVALGDRTLATGGLFTAESDSYVGILVTAGRAGIQLELGSTVSAYEPYAGQQYLVNIGIQQWDEDWEVGTIDNSTGLPDTDANNIRSKNFCPCIAGTQYNIVSKDSKVLRYYFYDKDETFISGGATSGTNTIVTAPTGACYFKVRTTSSYGSTYLSDISVNFPARFTDYFSYTGNVIYGGELDVTTGVLTLKYGRVDLGNLAWKKSGEPSIFFVNEVDSWIKLPPTLNDAFNGACDTYKVIAYGQWRDTDQAVYTSWATAASKQLFVKDSSYASADAATFKTAMSGVQLVYELATPISIQLDPTEVDTLRGDNVIWADCGDITNCEYRADLKLYIDKVVG